MNKKCGCVRYSFVSLFCNTASGLFSFLTDSTFKTPKLFTALTSSVSLRMIYLLLSLHFSWLTLHVDTSLVTRLHSNHLSMSLSSKAPLIVKDIHMSICWLKKVKLFVGPLVSRVLSMVFDRLILSFHGRNFRK